ncbi:MAG: hypothetical protein LBJ91_05065 [Clostridiales Family XIII bacterium]|jgi:hypothetical protein|nr:hypothetical protein [Clostridiales Family XIII bacterium]
MGFFDKIGSAAGMLAGKIEKAVLIVDSTAEKTDPGGGAAGASRLGAAASLLSSAASAGASGGGTTTIEVQFNPNTIRIDANAESMRAKYMLSHVEGLPNTTNRAASIVLNIDLIFDAVQNSDAFHADGLRLSASDIVSHGGAFIAGKKYSVMKQTNGMVSLLIGIQSPVEFKWGAFSFSGIVSEVQARYLMFSPSGHPIRSKVSVRIVQSLTKEKEFLYWDNAYNNFFGSEDVLAAHARDALQTQQSFFNL